MIATYCSLVAMTQCMMGCGFGHGEVVRYAPTVREVVVVARPALASCCDVCGIETAKVRHEVGRLLTSPRWRQRDNGAHALRKFDWRCHPEILGALSQAMLMDCEEEVREEAAETLARINPPPCVPEVHAALERAATCDPDHATRKQARRALERIGTHCVAPCAVCEPGVEIVVPPTGEYIVEPPAAYPPMGEALPPGSYLDSEPMLEAPGFEVEPGLPAPSLAPPGLPSPSVPPLPGDAEYFDVAPEARRSADEPAREVARRSTVEESRGKRPILGLFRRGR